LTLRGGTYVEEVSISKLAGKPGQEISIRSYAGERAVIDSSIPIFRTATATPPAWVPASTIDPSAHPDEWASADPPFPDKVLPVRGAFLGTPYRRLISYSTKQDFQADNQTFGKIFDPETCPSRQPYRVTDEHGTPLLDEDEQDHTKKEFTYPWVYMGPGIWRRSENRVHIRLTHTTNNIPGLEDYTGPTDPNQLGLAICDLNRTTLTIEGSRCLVFKDLTLRFGGRNTVHIDNCHCLVFDGVEIWASTIGVRFGTAEQVTFRDCRLDGGLPPWFFRGDRKNEYDYLPELGQPKLHNTLGKGTIDVLMSGEGYGRRDFDIHHCEFVNGHDLYLVASNMHFHHNWIDNLHDEGMMLDTQPSASGRIHSNVITRCLSPISMATGHATSGHWYLYRNLIDLRAPTAGKRPESTGDTAVWRFGNAFKSNEDTAPDGPYDVFHNTFLVRDQQGQASYLHYRSDASPNPRRSFNNIFVAVNTEPLSDVALTYLPPPSFPGPTDGNLYYRIGAANKPAFKAVPYTLDCKDFRAPEFATLNDFRCSEMFEQSHRVYPPGYEATGQLTDPGFRSIGADGTFNPLDDLRLTADSPARSAGIPLPPDLQDLDSDATAPIPPSRDIGCYAHNELLYVGVLGQRQFPIIGTV
jgi:hypothetical protein